jgi:hypothetical protein
MGFSAKIICVRSRIKQSKKPKSIFLKNVSWGRKLMNKGQNLPNIQITEV